MGHDVGFTTGQDDPIVRVSVLVVPMEGEHAAQEVQEQLGTEVMVVVDDCVTVVGAWEGQVLSHVGLTVMIEAEPGAAEQVALFVRVWVSVHVVVNQKVVEWFSLLTTVQVTMP